MKTCCYDDHLPYTLWCSCKDLPEVPGLNPGWDSFLLLFLIRPIIIAFLQWVELGCGCSGYIYILWE